MDGSFETNLNRNGRPPMKLLDILLISKGLATYTQNNFGEPVKV